MTAWPQGIVPCAAAALALVGTYHAARLQRPAWRVRVPRRDAEVAHLAMALAMIAMLTVRLGWAVDVLGAGFGLAALGFAWRAVSAWVQDGRTSGCSGGSEAVGCAATAAMLAAASTAVRLPLGFGSSAMSGHAMSASHAAAPVATTALIAACAVVAVVLPARRPTRLAGLGPAPVLGLGCRMIMGVTTVAMLATA